MPLYCEETSAYTNHDNAPSDHTIVNTTMGRNNQEFHSLRARPSRPIPGNPDPAVHQKNFWSEVISLFAFFSLILVSIPLPFLMSQKTWCSEADHIGKQYQRAKHHQSSSFLTARPVLRESCQTAKLMLTLPVRKHKIHVSCVFSVDVTRISIIFSSSSSTPKLIKQVLV